MLPCQKPIEPSMFERATRANSASMWFNFSNSKLINSPPFCWITLFVNPYAFSNCLSNVAARRSSSAVNCFHVGGRTVGVLNSAKLNKMSQLEKNSVKIDNKSFPRFSHSLHALLSSKNTLESRIFLNNHECHFLFKISHKIAAPERYLQFHGSECVQLDHCESAGFDRLRYAQLIDQTSVTFHWSLKKDRFQFLVNN